MKTTTKIIICMLIISIIGIGMPIAFSAGTGQHNFRQIDPNDPSAFCEKCHGGNDGIMAELSTSGTGVYSQLKIHTTLKCVDCHALTSDYGQGIPSSTKTQHAATIPTCTKCHVGTNAVMGFDVGAELNNSREAHKNFNDEISCIGCHTSIAVTGSVSYTYENGQTEFGLKIGN